MRVNSSETFLALVAAYALIVAICFVVTAQLAARAIRHWWRKR